VPQRAEGSGRAPLAPGAEASAGRSTLRLFVALDPPAAVRERLAAIAAELRARAGRAAADVRWVPPGSLHLTLQFLGAVAEDRVDAIRGAVAAAAAAAPPIVLRVEGAGAFPSPRRPRVLWAGLAGDVAPLAALVQDLGARLAPLGHPPEARPFSAHLTLGRARDPRGAPRLAAALAPLAPAPPVAWRAEEVVLVRSHLSPKGSRYEAIARSPLGGSSGP
jgi:2'-5' RNA ligase